MKKVLFLLILIEIYGTLLSDATAGGKAGRRIKLGVSNSGATVTFVQDVTGEWGLEIAGGATPVLKQIRPAQFEVYSGEGQEVRALAAGYTTLKSGKGGWTAHAKVNLSESVSFLVEDFWYIKTGILNLKRKVEVNGNAPGGFYSAIKFSTNSDIEWSDLDFLAPGLLYGDPTYDGLSSPGGMLNYKERHFWIREDLLPAPLFAISFRDGTSFTVLDPVPDGNSTLEETKAEPGRVMTDERFRFGALGANSSENGGIEAGFWFPGSTNAFQGNKPSWRRRYHPLKNGFSQNYEVAFRLSSNESFPELTRNAWRWAWQVLKPELNWHDIEVVRRSLIDQLSSQVMTVEDRTGLPFFVSTVTGKLWADPPAERWPYTISHYPSTRAVMGFVGKNIESADQLLREGDRDPGPRGQLMRKQGLAVIETFIRYVPMSPPPGSGFDLATGIPIWNHPPSNQWYLRGPVEDMRTLLQAYNRELKLGREHPEWLAWACQLGDWLLTKQLPDGSFPRSFKPGTEEIVDSSGTTSYNPVPMYVMLTRITGEKKYIDAAIRAADYVWQSFGSRGVFIGGAIDNPNITDKEAGMLAMEAFMTLYEATNDEKWLQRARVAGDFAESWTWIWNVPMPDDADDNEIHWKKNVSTVGVQGITAQVAGHVDQYLDWAVGTYVKLFKYTKDEHYLDIARLLLHNSKAMLALPGRLYGMLGPGWQQENWRMGPAREGRGFGTPEKWMPWVTTNHLYGITMLEEIDPVIFRQLCLPLKGK